MSYFGFEQLYQADLYQTDLFITLLFITQYSNPNK